MGTGETNASTEDANEPISPHNTTTTPSSHDGPSDHQDLQEPGDEDVDTYLRRNAHKLVTGTYATTNRNRRSLLVLLLTSCSPTQLHAMMARMAKRLPSPVADEHELPSVGPQGSEVMPTILKAAVRMFPQVKILAEELQEISVAMEIEGVLCGDRGPLPDVTIDVIFVVDNGYVFTRHLIWVG
jgi:hypothetical protein